MVGETFKRSISNQKNAQLKTARALKNSFWFCVLSIFWYVGDKLGLRKTERSCKYIDSCVNGGVWFGVLPTNVTSPSSAVQITGSHG